MEVRTVGRKNRRNKKDYRQRLGFNPDKYTKQSEHSKKKATFGKSYRNTYSVSKYKPERPYRVPYRGEIWVAQLGSHPNTSVQEGCRPVLIVSNDKGNHTSNTVVVLPLTSHLKRYNLPSHVMLRQGDVVLVNQSRSFDDSMILAEQITTISKSALRNCIGRVTDAEKLNEISEAVRIQLAI